MKRFLPAVLAVLLLLAMLTGCAQPGGPDVEPEAPVTGGVTDTSDPNAPKTIESTEITKFYCYFSTLTLAEPGALGNRAFTMTAEADGDTVTGTYQVWGEGEFDREFTADRAFLEELQSVVGEQYDLAQHNGHHYYVAGLPEDFGATLEVDYASGEKIRADDNQDNFLSFGAMGALRELFSRTAAAIPEPVNLLVEDRYEAPDAGFVAYPEISVADPGYGALSDALTEINETEAEPARRALEDFDDLPAGGYSSYQTTAKVTRSDSEYVSLYTRTECSDGNPEDDTFFYRGYTVETATGRLLGFRDILNDMELMPIAISTELVREYPDTVFYGDTMERLKSAVDSDSGDVAFALSYGFVDIFLDGYYVSDAPEGHHVALSFADYPNLLIGACQTWPENYLIPVECGVDYRLDSGNDLRMDWIQEEEEMDGIFTISANGGTATEEYYGYAPDVRLIRSEDRLLLYVRMPSGDVTMRTDVFELTADGVEKLGQAPVAISPSCGIDPRAMEMDQDRLVYSMATVLLPSGFYCVGDDGMPEQVGNLCKLSGRPVTLRQSGRYNPADRADAAASGGMWNLFEGAVLTPLQTDLETFLDFITEDGRVVRFTIDGFHDDMTLDNFGTLDDVFAPAE